MTTFSQSLKNLPAVQETRVRSLGWKDPLEKEMATHSNILAWKISWTEKPGGLQSMGSQRVAQDWATKTYLWWCKLWASLVVLVVKNLPANAGDIRDIDACVRKICWRRAWKPSQVISPGEFHGQRSLEGYSPWGHKESDVTEHIIIHVFIFIYWPHNVACRIIVP